MSKKKPQWQATVDLPPASSTSKPIVVRYRGSTLPLDTLAQVELNDLEPARTFKSRPTSRNRTNQPYLYNRARHIAVESETEAIEAHLADRDPNVQTIIPQGAWIKGLIRPLADRAAAPKWGWSCVDFIVGYTDGTIAAIEVKRHDYVFKKKPAAKLLATADSCQAIGLTYRLMAGLPRREWLTFYQLHASRRHLYQSHPWHDQIRQTMTARAATGAATVGELRRLDDPTVSTTLLWELLWHGSLCIDWSQPVTSTTPVRLHGDACNQARGTSAWDFQCGPRRENMLPALRDWANGDA